MRSGGESGTRASRRCWPAVIQAGVIRSQRDAGNLTHLERLNSRTSTSHRTPGSSAQPTAENAQDLIKDVVEVFAKVIGEEPENEVTVQLQEGVFAAVAAVGGGVGEVLESVEFDDEAGGGAEKIDFHFAVFVEGDGEPGVELEVSGELGVGFEAAVEKGFAGAAGTGGSLGIGSRGAGDVDEKLGEGRIDTVTNEAADTGGVVGFPLRGDGEQHGGRPAGEGAGGE